MEEWARLRGVPVPKTNGLIVKIAKLAPAIALAALATTASAQCLNWSASFGPPNGGQGMNARVYDLATWIDTTASLAPYLSLFAAGDFTQAGTTAANCIASWNGNQWTPLGTGCNNSVFTLYANRDVNSNYSGVWAGGAFTTSNGTTTNHITRWTGGFSPLTDSSSQTGVNGNVFAIQAWGSELFMAGTFSQAGSTPANNIARWDGTNFLPLTTASINGTSGGSIAGRVDALTVFNDGGGDALYAGGWFTAAGPVPSGLIAKWDGTAWVSMGVGLSGSNVYDLCEFNGELYAAGLFSLAGGSLSVNNIAKWNGTTWSTVGTGFNNVVRDLQVFDDGSGPALYATGHFTADGTNNIPLDHIAKFNVNTSTWQSLTGLDIGGGAISLCMCDYDDLKGGGSDLFVGSICTSAGGNASNYIAKYFGCNKAPFPVLSGEIAVTHEPGTALDFGLSVIDMNGTPAPVGTHWKAPQFHNEYTGNPAADAWNRNNLGYLFGVCFDAAQPPNIYCAATSVYGNPFFAAGGPGGVYKINGLTGTVSTLMSLPNSGAALGDICYNPWPQNTYGKQLYVSNFADGKIYRYNLNGVQLGTAYDPFPSTTNTAGYVQLGERVWALQVFNARELYFSVWLRDHGRPTTPWPTSWGPQGNNIVNNAIFKVWIDPVSGTIDPNNIGPTLVKVIPYLPNETHSNPVSDIAYSRDNKRMLVTEKAMEGDAQEYYWEGRALQYVGGGPANQYVNWALSTTEYQVGNLLLNGERHCAVGGGDYDCADRVIATSDPIGNNQGSNMTGIQRLPAIGNNSAIGVTTSHLIDMDGETVGFDKLGIGDVEVYRGACRRRWTTYCTALVNSLGCTPAIDASGDPSLSAGGFTITCGNVRNSKPGLLLYSVTGPAAVPFLGGTLCLATPLKRAPGVNSGGSPPGTSDCTGAFSFDMTAFALGLLGGTPLLALSTPGTVVDCQYWSRDQGAVANASLSDALEYVVDP